MPKTEPKTTIFTLRLTPEERARLEKDAGSLALGEYVRLKLFGQNIRQAVRPRRKRKAAPLRNDFNSAQVLAVLGKSEIAASLRTLAKAARLGALPVTAETEQALQSSCARIDAAVSALMAALRVKDR